MALLFIEILIFLATLSASDIKGLEPVAGLHLEECIDCHGDKTDHEIMHEAVEIGCDVCHESTGEAHPEDGVMGFKLVDRTPDLCLSCHHITQGKAILHSAIENGGCMICHQPHGSEFRVLLSDRYPAEDYLVASTDSFGLCFMCHDTDLLEAEKSEWATNFRHGDQNLHYIHMNGAKGRNCKFCHNLHGSDQTFLIEESVPFGNWEMQMNFIATEEGGSCLPGCHGKKVYSRQ